MQLGVDGVFVGSGIFKSSDPAKRARAMVQAVTHYNDPKILADVSTNLGEAMVYTFTISYTCVAFCHVARTYESSSTNAHTHTID